MADLKASPGRCEEASVFSSEAYIPCNAPATVLIKTRDVRPYRMCPECADHNVRNRGAQILRPLTSEERMTTPAADDLPLDDDLDLPLDGVDEDLPLAETDDDLPLDEGGDERERILPPQDLDIDVVHLHVAPNIAATPIIEILPADFPLPTLIKFVPNQELKRALDVSVAYALGIDVKGRDKLALADAAVGTLRDRIKAIQAHFEEPASIADRLHKGVTSTRAAWLKEAEATVKTVGTRVATETRRLEDEAAALRRKDQAAADQRAREDAQQRVEQAKAQQAPPEVVETLQQQATVARAEPVQPAAGSASAAPLLANNSIVTTWKARFKNTGGAGDEDPHPEFENWTDLHRKGFLALLKDIVDGKAPLRCVEPNWTYLDQRAVSDQKALSLAGIEAFSQSGARAKAQRRR